MHERANRRSECAAEPEAPPRRGPDRGDSVRESTRVCQRGRDPQSSVKFDRKNPHTRSQDEEVPCVADAVTKKFCDFIDIVVCTCSQRHLVSHSRRAKPRPNRFFGMQLTSGQSQLLYSDGGQSLATLQLSTRLTTSRSYHVYTPLSHTAPAPLCHISVAPHAAPH